MKEGRTHEISECKVENSNIKTSSIKSEVLDVSVDAPQRSTPQDNFVELKITNLCPGIAYIINGVYVKTRYSNWSESMQIDDKEVFILFFLLHLLSQIF